MLQIVPSLLSADFARLAEEIARGVERAEARPCCIFDVYGRAFCAESEFMGPPVWWSRFAR